MELIVSVLSLGRGRSARATCLLLFTIALLPCMALAEPEFAVGDRVSVDTNMASDPAYQTWRPATVTAVQMWQGQVSGISVRTDDGLELMTAARFLRAGSPAPAPALPVPADPVTATTPESRAAPDADPGTGNCRVGIRVRDRDGNTGIVVRATGASCHVRLDDTGEEGYYLQWMLTPADASQATAAGGTALEPGSYACWAANGVAGTLKLVIVDSSHYSDGTGNLGRYAFDPASGAIQWQAGPWDGFHGKRLGPGRIGISSRPGGFFATTCELG